MILNFVRQRFTGRPDSEHRQALVRLGFVSIAFVWFFTSYVAARVDDIPLRAAQLVVSISMVCSLSILAAIAWRPGASVARRLLGTVHDVTAISLGMYFGEGAGAAISVLYLWITIGSGFRYGVAYLYASAALSITGFGIVYLSSDFWQREGHLSLNILLVMILVAPYVGSLLRELNRAKDALEKQASTDGLTGLMNRTQIEEAIASVFDGDAAGHVLLFCDLDRFKEINDVAGHAAGDKLLADIGDIIRRSVRKDDLSGRMGGDEFCVLLRNCSLERGREIAETIRSKITGYRLAWGTEYFSVGTSIGVAPSDAVNDPESFFRLADAACYAAKNAGRNRVHIVDPRVDDLNTQKIRLMVEDATRRYAVIDQDKASESR